MAYRTRKDVSTHEQLLNEIITFKEVFCHIFYRSVGNPRIKIMAYNPLEGKSYLFEISTKYNRNRHTTSTIRKEFNNIIVENGFLKDFDNISSVVFTAKGTRHGEQLIYDNPDTPWQNQMPFK